MADGNSEVALDRPALFKEDMPFGDYRKLLEKQGYRFIGEHSAVKVCEWTKKSLRGEGVCYKQKFYGIKSHRCCQMSVSVNFCNLDCVFCWRDRNNTRYEKVDDPKQIVRKAQEAQRKLLYGFGGLARVDKGKYEESLTPVHFAISLTGETLSYPLLSALLEEIERAGCTSFVVTNGMFPKAMAKMHPPTQLYVSLSAPTEERFLAIDRPMDKKDGWKTLMESFDVLATLKGKTRTVIRCTLIKGLNMQTPKKWASIISRGDPDFVEVKSYMWLGASQNRLQKSNMARFEELKRFASSIGRYCGYRIIDEQRVSNVVLLAKEDTPDRMLEMADR